MRKLIIFVLLIFISPNITLANTKKIRLSDNRVPQVVLFYAAMFDHVCTIKTTYKIKPSWEHELNRDLLHWQTFWDSEGVLLLKATVKLIDKPFTQQYFQAALSLCNFPSMSAPLIVNARYALHSFIAQPIPDYVFVSIIYHEILHNYIDSFLPKNTPLLAKYKNESIGVLNHLHLFALEKAVYLQLGLKSKLDAIIAKDESLPNNDYKIAWEIINKKENYADFIDELKKYKDS